MKKLIGSMQHMTVDRSAFRKIRNMFSTCPTAIILVAVLVITYIGMPRFFNPYNVYTILGSQDFICIGLMAIGVTFVISAAEIDLSVAGICVASSIIAALLAPFGGIVSVLGAVLFGAMVGTLSGFLVAKVGLPSIIVTLAMLMALRGLSLIMSNNGRVPVDRTFSLVRFYQTRIGVIPVVALVLLIIAILAWFVYTRTRFGVHVLAIGADGDSSELMGLRPEGIRWLIFIISGALSGLAGAFLLAKTTTGNPLEANGWEMTAIAAVVVGGTLLSGGKGSIGGTISGVALLTLIFQILNFVNGMGLEINTYVQNIIRGIFVLLVVVAQAGVELRKRRVLA